MPQAENSGSTAWWLRKLCCGALVHPTRFQILTKGHIMHYSLYFLSSAGCKLSVKLFLREIKPRWVTCIHLALMLPRCRCGVWSNCCNVSPMFQDCSALRPWWKVADVSQILVNQSCVRKVRPDVQSHVTLPVMQIHTPFALFHFPTRWWALQA